MFDPQPTEAQLGIDIDASGRLTTASDLPLLDVAAALGRAGRYLPVDAPRGDSTVAAALLHPTPGPRALGYGPAWRWVEAVTLSGGRTLSAPDARTLAGLSEAELLRVSWHSLPLPAAGRTVLGRFRDAEALARALAPLAAERPAGLVAVELCDRVTARWLIGRDPGLPFTLVLRAEGATEATALAWRKAWQSVELAGAEATDLPRGHWRWGPVAPAGGPPMARLVLEAAPATLPGLLAAAGELAPLLGGAAARAQVLLGQLQVWLPAGPQLDRALSWLRERALKAGARWTLAGHPEPGP